MQYLPDFRYWTNLRTWKCSLRNGRMFWEDEMAGQGRLCVLLLASAFAVGQNTGSPQGSGMGAPDQASPPNHGAKPDNQTQPSAGKKHRTHSKSKSTQDSSGKQTNPDSGQGANAARPGKRNGDKSDQNTPTQNEQTQNPTEQTPPPQSPPQQAPPQK
jgi:hypothetical protein